MLKKIGSWIGSIKKYFAELQNEISGYEYDNEDTDNLEKKKIKEKKEKQDEK